MEERPIPTIRRAGTAGDTSRPQRGNHTVNAASYQEFLAERIGYYIICEFLIGVDRLILRQGRLIDVGDSYFTLFEEDELAYTVCDLYSLKFVTYFNQGNRPTTEEFLDWLRTLQAANNIVYGSPAGSVAL